MNCNTFKKKMEDYLEDNLQNDMKKAMDDHISKCNSCKRICERENYIEDVLKSTLDIDPAMFTSPRGDIMASIDKTRYSKSFTKKIKFHFFRNNKRYAMAATLAFMISISAIYIKRGILNDLNSNFKIATNSEEILNKNNQSTKRIVTKPQEEKNDINMSDKSINVKTKVNGDEYIYIKESISPILEMKDNYVPSFTKENLNYDYNPKFATPWKSSKERQMAVCIEGKGEDGLEEGIGHIIVQDNKENSTWKLSVNNKDGKQNSPLYIEWGQDKNLFVIVGQGYGTIPSRKSVYSVNIDNMKTNLVYDTDSVKKQVSSIKNNKDNLELKLIVFNDETLNEYHEEKRVVNYKDVTGFRTEEVNHLYEFAKNIKDNNHEKAINLFDENFKQEYKSYIGDIQAISSMNIEKIIDITDASLAKDKPYDIKVYGVMANYKINDKMPTSLKSSTYYQRFVLIKYKEDTNWSIVQILTPPQN
ncbi:DUF4652 domain-containing protein [Clostridium amazonitimonense]|uniref:DUF4652 domain-containing protein n=1 Tax=Clostridium amazonitimonense TaxID=1499689 RepID=UPI000509D1E5|nr:DUF4652 domain-containing protein [Clostridium amazonitimonense]